MSERERRQHGPQDDFRDGGEMDGFKEESLRWLSRWLAAYKAQDLAALRELEEELGGIKDTAIGIRHGLVKHTDVGPAIKELLTDLELWP